MAIFGDQTMLHLSGALDLAALRQRISAHNLANLNTPNFKRAQLSFESALAQAQSSALNMARTHERHLQPAALNKEPRVVTDHSTTRRLDGNNVDLEREMLAMVTNQLRYNAYIQQINSRFDNWRFVINEGRR